MNSNENEPQNDAGTSPSDPQRNRGARALSTFSETFGLSRIAAIGLILFVSAVMVGGILWFIYSAPPRALIITSGPAGSSLQRYAEAYRKHLLSNGVEVVILESQGSMENLKRLADPAFRVDVGFVQTGESSEQQRAGLLSLGSVAYQPLLIFYRSPTPMNQLSEFAGKRLAIGAAGSGTRALATFLLETNGITAGGATTFLDLAPDDAAKALLDGRADAVFLMGDSASGQTMRMLLRSPGIQMFDFVQADAYTRRFPFLNKLEIPRGGIDLGKDMPSHDINLIGPAVELVGREKLHPALCDLLIEAAEQVHGQPNLLQHRGEFPAPLQHELKVNPEAVRYYKSGKSFLFRWMPFWLAILVSRIVVAFVPMLLLLVPALKFVPVLYRFRTQLRFYRWYRNLLRVERDLFGEMTPAKREELQRRLDHIEESVNRMKVPASFAGQFYGLREHIGFVRDRLGKG